MPTIFKNISDLPVGVTINGVDVFEMMQNGTNVQVTANTVAAAIGGGGAFVISAPPEGVVTANAGQFAFDSVNEALWIKTSGTNSSGWIQLI